MNLKQAKPGLWALGFVFAAAVFHAKCQDNDDKHLHEDPDDGADDHPDASPDENFDEDGPKALSQEQLRSLHKLVDKDQDGKASMLEFMDFAAEMRTLSAHKQSVYALAGMDTNKDGKLGMDELINDIEKHTGQAKEKGLQDKVAAMVEAETKKFKAADIDGDGLLNESELPAIFFPDLHTGVLEIAVQHTLLEKDRDNDGQLSVHEFWHDDHAGKDEPKISDDDHKDFEKLDENGDGLLSSHELKPWETGAFQVNEALRIVFEQADEDEDEYLSADELEAAKEHVAHNDANQYFMEWAEHSEL